MIDVKREMATDIQRDCGDCLHCRVRPKSGGAHCVRHLARRIHVDSGRVSYLACDFNRIAGDGDRYCGPEARYFEAA